MSAFPVRHGYGSVAARSLVAALALLARAPADDGPTLTLRKGGYSLSVAGDGRVPRWTTALFTLAGLMPGERVVWQRPVDGGVPEVLDVSYGASEGDRSASLRFPVMDDPGTRIPIRALVFRKGRVVPPYGQAARCDASLEIELRVVDGQSAATRDGAIRARLAGNGGDLRCIHTVEIRNDGPAPVPCDLRIVPEDGRPGIPAEPVEVPAGSTQTEHLDGRQSDKAIAHACRIEIRPRGAAEVLVLHTRPWVAPCRYRTDDPDPPPPPPSDG